MAWGIANDYIVFKKVKDAWKAYIKQYQYVDNENNLRVRQLPYRALIQFLNSEGSQELNAVVRQSIFKFPKPVGLIEFCMNLLPSKNITVLDFFAGSAPTTSWTTTASRRRAPASQVCRLARREREPILRRAPGGLHAWAPARVSAARVSSGGLPGVSRHEARQGRGGDVGARAGEDVLIGKVSPLPEEAPGMVQRFTKKDASTSLRQSESGIVDQVMLSTNEAGHRFVKSRVRVLARPRGGMRRRGARVGATGCLAQGGFDAQGCVQAGW